MLIFKKSVAQCQAVPCNKPPGVQYIRLEPYMFQEGSGQWLDMRIFLLFSTSAIVSITWVKGLLGWGRGLSCGRIERASLRLCFLF